MPPAPTDGRSRRLPVQRWHDGERVDADDAVVVEHPVAMVYNGIAHVVMMVTPVDLEDFALGFSLTEGIIGAADQLYEVAVVPAPEGTELQMRISSRCFEQLKTRRRNLTGRSGCGLCGAESLEQALRPLPSLPRGARLALPALRQAIAALDHDQSSQAETGAIHKALWCDASSGRILMQRDDVGRHNALDKLIGALAREGFTPAAGFALVSSRASYELVAKTAMAGIELLASVSAPTTLAVELAQACGLTLIGFARPGRHTVYVHPQRLLTE